MSRLIVVTGAGTGIGKAVATKFASQQDTVVLVGRRHAALEVAQKEIISQTNNTAVEIFAADCSLISDITKFHEYLQKKATPLSGIICCAGSPAQVGDKNLNSIAAEWNSTFTANVMTAVLAVEGLEPLIEDQGSIVLFSSIAAYRGSGGTGAYGAAKSALHSYAHGLAQRFGPRGINVNVIAPGYIADTDFFGGKIDSTRKKTLIEQTLLKRPGQPNDIAGLSYYLCSPEGAYITSQIIQINGGSSHGV